MRDQMAALCGNSSKISAEFCKNIQNAPWGKSLSKNQSKNWGGDRTRAREIDT
jgi:hypothetical protein